MALMKKTFFYKHLSSKEDEEEDELISERLRLTRADRFLIEIRDDFPPAINPMDPWKIEKHLTLGEISTGKLILTENEILEHVFRYWALEMCRQVLKGHRVCVLLYDVTIEAKPNVHGPCDQNTCVEKGLDDCFFLRINMDLFNNWGLRPGAKISLYWNYIINGFYLRVSN